MKRFIEGIVDLAFPPEAGDGEPAPFRRTLVAFLILAFAVLFAFLFS